MKQNNLEMSSETNGIQTISTRKSKKIKLSNEKSIINQVDNYPQKIEDLEWINHEIIIDDVMIEESGPNDTLNSGNNNKIKRGMIQLALPPFQSENDYSFSNSKGTETSSIMLRQDLFPDKSEEEKLIKATIPSETTSQSKPVKTSSLKLTHFQKDKSRVVTNSKETSFSSKFPVVLKKLDPKEVPVQIKEARNLLKSNMNLTAACKINQVALKHSRSSLQKGESERIEIGMKKVLNITENNKNFIMEKHKLKEHFGETTTKHKPHSTNNLKKKGIEQKQNNAPIIESNSQEKVEDFTRKSNLGQLKPECGKMQGNYVKISKPELKSEKSILLKKVESSQVPEQIKKSLLIRKSNTVSNQNRNTSKVNISSNIIKVLKSDTSEVRLSSLANASQDSAVGSTTKTSSVLGQNVLKPSTSNHVEFTDYNVNKVVNTESTLTDYTKDISDDDDTDEELGLNSLEELQQYWEFLVDLHDYNKQVIKSLQNRKRRYLLRINKLEHHLKHDLGIQLEESEEEDDECSELSMKEVEQRTEEENSVVEKENRPTEE